MVEMVNLWPVSVVVTRRTERSSGEEGRLKPQQKGAMLLKYVNLKMP